MNVSPSLREFIRPLEEFLASPDVTELCINRPGEVFVETRKGWTRHECPTFSYGWANAFATTTAASNTRWVDGQKTLLSAELPGGERIFIVYPPSCESGTIAITIRKPSPVALTHADLVKGGIYQRVKKSIVELDSFEEELVRLHKEGDYEAFMRLAVISRRNIIASGATGSGKTTFANAIIEFIDGNDRIITIEDTRELRLPNHGNHVHLLYESDGSKECDVTPDQLLRATLRMRPDRILLSEIRGPEALDFIVSVNSGHPGTITSIHAETALGVIDKIAVLIEAGGVKFTRETLERLLWSSVDVIVQFNTVQGPNGTERGISEIYYDPMKKRRLLMG
jgi:type IV secretion system protein VirB11